MENRRLRRKSEKGDWEVLNGDAIDIITQKIDITGAVRLAACSRELYERIGNSEGNKLRWDEPCLLMPQLEHWDEAGDYLCLDDTVYDVVPLDHSRHTAVLPFMDNRFWVGMNGNWIAAVDDHGDWYLANIYTERLIPLPSPNTCKVEHNPFNFDYCSIESYSCTDWVHWDGSLTLKKIVICEVPTKDGHYADYKLIALFDQALAYLEGGSKEWRLLDKAASLQRRDYCDAIELGGFIFAVDGLSGSTYCWDAAHAGNVLVSMLHSMIF